MEKSELKELTAELERATHASRSQAVLLIQVTIWSIIGGVLSALGLAFGSNGFGAFLVVCGALGFIFGAVRGVYLARIEYDLSGRGSGVETTNRIAELSLNEGERFAWEQSGKPDLRAWVEAGRPNFKNWLSQSSNP